MGGRKDENEGKGRKEANEEKGKNGDGAGKQTG